jgi:Zn-dependent protease/predicted transcriptional regulator
MNWSLTIARVSDINIRVHVTFLLILVLGALQWGGFGIAGAAFGVLLMLLLFACVTLHELGHSLVAQRFGIPVREIILLPLGGIALLGRNATNPVHELLIAVAGPLVNVVIAAVLWIVGAGVLDIISPDMRQLQVVAGQPSLSTALVWLFGANVALVLFNLIPAFPLDGGRMLRALLWMAFGVRRADQVASFLGQTIAIVLGIFGVASGNFGLILIAVFVFFGAGQQNAEGQAQTVLSTRRVGDAYNRHVLTLGPADRVSQVVGYLLTSYQPDFAVLLGGRLVGVVTRDAVLRALAGREGDGYVSGIMDREVPRVDARLTLEEVREKLAEQGARVAAVFSGETYLGLISREDIAEAFAVLRYVEAAGRPQTGEVMT